MDADSRMAPDLAARVVRRGRRGYPAGSIRIIADSHDPLDRAFFGLLEFGKDLFKLQAQMFYCSRELFTRLGGFAEGLWTKDGDNKWKIAITGTQRDGKKVSGTNLFTKVDDDHFSFKIVDMKVDGKSVPDTQLVKMKRVR